MHPDVYKALVEKFIYEEVLPLNDTKGVDYAENDDRLANFKQIAAQTGITPFQVWAVYAGKHSDSIFKAIRRNPTLPVKKGEPLSENIKDVIAYHLLLLGLLKEANDTIMRSMP